MPKGDASRGPTVIPGEVPNGMKGRATKLPGSTSVSSLMDAAAWICVALISDVEAARDERVAIGVTSRGAVDSSTINEGATGVFASTSESTGSSEREKMLLVEKAEPKEEEVTAEVEATEAREEKEEGGAEEALPVHTMQGREGRGAHSCCVAAQKASPPPKHSEPVHRPPIVTEEADEAFDWVDEEGQYAVQREFGQVAPQFTPLPAWKTEKRGSQLSSHGPLACTHWLMSRQQ